MGVFFPHMAPGRLIKPLGRGYLPIFDIRISDVDFAEENRMKHLKCYI